MKSKNNITGRLLMVLAFIISFPVISSAQNTMLIQSIEGGDSSLIQDIRKLSFQNESLVINLRNSDQDKNFLLDNITEISFVYDKTKVDVQKTLTSISFKYFPNPVENLLNIDVPATQMKVIEIFNTQGQKVNSWHWISEKQIDVSALDSGLYIIRALFGDKIVVSKFLKS